jgi:hypothetical protein
MMTWKAQTTQDMDHWWAFWTTQMEAARQLLQQMDFVFDHKGKGLQESWWE